MNKETIKSRQDLRQELLTELYEHYFNPNNKGTKKRMIQIDVQKLKEDSEKELAYIYLKNKGFITEHGGNGISAFLITTAGIDYLEDILQVK